jgi:hypothetical protein
MKQMDHDKVSWLEFLKSIRFANHEPVAHTAECSSPFAGFNPQARAGRQKSAEDSQLIRSAN